MLGKNPLPDLPPEKVGRMGGHTGGILDPNSSDHVIAMTQLKETIASLHKKISMKDKELLEKDKMVSGEFKRGIHGITSHPLPSR